MINNFNYLSGNRIVYLEENIFGANTKIPQDLFVHLTPFFNNIVFDERSESQQFDHSSQSFLFCNYCLSIRDVCSFSYSFPFHSYLFVFSTVTCPTTVLIAHSILTLSLKTVRTKVTHIVHHPTCVLVWKSSKKTIASNATLQTKMLCVMFACLVINTQMDVDV